MTRDLDTVIPTLVVDGVSLEAADPRKMGHDQELALSDVTFVVGRGESVGLLGNRSSGKSALANVILGESRPKSGTVYVRSQPAVISKASVFVKDETVEYNMVRILQASGLVGSRLRSSLRRIAAELDIADIHSPVQDLESIEIDRIRLVCVLATDPELLIIDDPKFRLNSILGGRPWIDDYLATGGSLLITSDNPRSLGVWVQRTLWLDRGQLMGDGAPRIIARSFNAIAVAEQEGNRAKARQLERRYRADYVPTTLVFTGSGRRRAAANTETQP